MNNVVADEIEQLVARTSALSDVKLPVRLCYEIIIALRKPCPHIVTDKDGTSYCSLAEPSGDKVLVPREPTDAMVEAGQCAKRGADSEDHICHIWHDMLAALESH